MKIPAIAMLNIGSELLRGRTLNTNALDAAILLAQAGFALQESITIHDEEREIVRALKDLLSRNDVVIVTGGLGPTRDDLTKKVLAKFFGAVEWKHHQPTLDMLIDWVAKRNRPLNEKMKEQAWMPDICTVIPNRVGTSPGMKFEQNGKLVFSLPGVPSEMKWLMSHGVIDQISTDFQAKPVELKILRCFGIAESDIAHLVDELGPAISAKVDIAYLPHDGEVKIELRTRQNDLMELENTFRILKAELLKFVFSENSDPVEKIFGERLVEKKLTVSCAESCSGGALARLLTSVSGSSRYFKGSAVTYLPESKISVLGIPPGLIEKHSAVSPEIAVAMAKAAQKIFNSDIGISITGTAEVVEGDSVYGKPGIWFAVALKNECIVRELVFLQERNSNIRRAASTAIHLALKQL